MNKFNVNLEWHQNTHWCLNSYEPQRNVGSRFASDMWNESEVINCLMEDYGLFMNDVIHGAFWPEGSRNINVNDNQDGKFVLTVNFALGPTGSRNADEVADLLIVILSDTEYAYIAPTIRVEKVKV